MNKAYIVKTYNGVIKETVIAKSLHTVIGFLAERHITAINYNEVKSHTDMFREFVQVIEVDGVEIQVDVVLADVI